LTCPRVNKTVAISNCRLGEDLAIRDGSFRAESFGVLPERSAAICPVASPLRETP
jgi:hypothetical protein